MNLTINVFFFFAICSVLAVSLLLNLKAKLRISDQKSQNFSLMSEIALLRIIVYKELSSIMIIKEFPVALIEMYSDKIKKLFLDYFLVISTYEPSDVIPKMFRFVKAVTYVPTKTNEEKIEKGYLAKIGKLQSLATDALVDLDPKNFAQILSKIIVADTLSHPSSTDKRSQEILGYFYSFLNASHLFSNQNKEKLLPFFSREIDKAVDAAKDNDDANLIKAGAVKISRLLKNTA